MTTLHWHDNRWRPLEAPAADAFGDVLVADSWFVDQGRTLALPLHRARFIDGVARQSGNGASAAAAFDAFAATVPRSGLWFPRIDRHSAAFVARLRKAPQRFTGTVLATAPFDPRTLPNIKGPDLSALAELRVLAQQDGADEAVILSNGNVVEGALSALLWWRNDTLHMPPLDVPRVDSVTARSVLAIANAQGVEVREELATPSQLEGSEVWALSALHGIRAAVDWVAGPTLAKATRAPTWQRLLDALRR